MDEAKTLVLIQYLGDESTAIAVPHGNRKRGNRAYVRTCPSVLKVIKERVKDSKVETVYKKMVIEKKIANRHQGICNPRNMKQVESQNLK